MLLRRLLNSLDFWIGLTFCLCAMAYTAYLGEDQNWDLQNYHYYTGYSYLNNRESVDIAAAGFQSFLHPAINILAYVALSKLPFPFSIWLILSVQLLSVPALILISREIANAAGIKKNSIPRLIGIAICLLSPLWISELGTSFFSSTTAPLVLWGIYLLLKLNPANPKTSWFISGLLLGLSVALKLTNAPFVISAGISATYITFRIKNRDIPRLICFIGGGAIGVLCATSWYWSLWTKWQSPVFPLYNGIFKSPFFPSTNFRDDRWAFQSTIDFFVFIAQTALGSAKTSEFYFADTRYLILISLLPSLFISKIIGKTNARIEAFLIFFFTAMGLWALSLAYQRYLIPIELVTGIAIWLVVSLVSKSEKTQTVAMTLFLAISLTFVKIPDWGHARSMVDIHAPTDLIWKRPATKVVDRKEIHDGAFNLIIPEKLTSTPANYLVLGNPISYILPYLHPASHFYGVGVSPAIDSLIATRLRIDRALPVRILMLPTAGNYAKSILSKLDVGMEQYVFNCTDIIGSIGRYRVCELIEPKKQNATQTIAEANYSGGKYKYKSTGVLFETGLSGLESWGRWSDSETVEWGLDKCLPTGAISVTLTAHAFGPNIGKPFMMSLGAASKTFLLSGIDSQISITFENAEPCANSLRIAIPKSISPQQMGVNNDGRKLGLGIQAFDIQRAKLAH